MILAVFLAYTKNQRERGRNEDDDINKSNETTTTMVTALHMNGDIERKNSVKNIE